MFRLSAEPVRCPFPYTYTFTYNRGHAECTYPLSTVDSCTEDWRILFRYQACPDIQGTESTTEELVCLAAWKEGSNRYLVGKSEHPLAMSDEDRYQCFVYKSWDNNTASGIMMAQSGDATCNGLYSVTGGSMTLVLRRVDTSGSKCRFPVWSNGPKWRSLDGHTTLDVNRHNSTLKLTSHAHSGPVTHACLEPFAHTKHSATYVTRVIYGCTSGYQCVHMLARDDHVLEIIMGKVTPVAVAACSPQYFDISSNNFTTFVRSTAESRQCPGTGRYEVVGGGSVGVDIRASAVASTSRSGGGGGGGSVAGGGGLGVPGGGGSGGELIPGHHSSECEDLPYTSLSVGCSTTDTLVISNRCSSAEYSCHGWWEEGGRQYLVVTPISRSSKGFRHLCLVLDHGSGVLSLASSTLSCGRDLTPGLHGHIALNTTSVGGCRSSPPINGGCGLVPSVWVLLVVTALLALLAPTSASPSGVVVAWW
ncbi:uncharacterized protein [Procambarus clarkii]|uniref:uncharacterized protein n=1 Tax=Procambarus clarkii TaxID=6728 RepID=UPI0037422E1C